MIASVFHELPSLLEVPSLLPYPRGNLGIVLILSFSHYFLTLSTLSSFPFYFWKDCLKDQAA